MELEHEAYAFVSESRQLAFTHTSHIRAVYHHHAPIGPVERADYLEQGGFARTARSHDAHHLAFLHLHVDAAQYLQGTETLRYVR